MNKKQGQQRANAFISRLIVAIVGHASLLVMLQSMKFSFLTVPKYAQGFIHMPFDKSRRIRSIFSTNWASK
ncbi:MAG: hypothetical protein U5K79_14280 [Cyclobacteriaceae bacterium]|nr:hypothetical protein [Cyclobacteriaceae bacterium]